MNVLGIHIGHDSSASLISNGKIVADIAEERFTRVKHYAGFPALSISECLEIGGLKISDIDVVAVASSYKQESLDYFFDLKGCKSEKDFLRGMAKFLLKPIMPDRVKRPPLYMKRFPLKSSALICHVDHHTAHAASAYYTSGLEEPQLIITMDGVGDHGISMTISRGEKGKITLLKAFHQNASLGWFYGNVTEALDWHHGDGEGKTMGLAPYGDFTKTRGVLEGFYPKFENGDLVKAHNFGTPCYWNDNGSFQWHFNDADKIKKIVEKYGKEDVSAEAQRILEEEAGKIIYPWLEKEKLSNLSCAGGVFLNVKLNQRVWESGKVIKHHICPNAGDAGLSMGAALKVYHDLNPGSPILGLNHLYLGPAYSNEKIKDILDARNLKYEFVEDIASFTAKLLADNKIVGWFQGRMESGPRSLGGRAILMSPLKEENKDIINARVKFREAFRPFCPSVLIEKGKDYLVRYRPECFMITSFDVQPKKKKAVPAVVHVDGTLRPQTVSRDVHPRYWELIKAFGDKTGEYIILNTSFNIKGEPIICHPREAIRCFYDTGLDYLVMGNYVLKK
ncbi:carbamoyl transferase, NodU family [Candidatus Omnitrophus magneticus]|uniref:Carbamoyl transferase, NodU family n=1 Tax=Candidatus Omnitrophus magneticus TaxID=1609969 RepID=A0A0F0CU10_9BACT|nr:carbamoyl transferase, NodU family [Candidatus Omnitrophus magneticus]